MSSPQIQQSNKLEKNVSAVMFTRPVSVLVARIGTTNWQRYPSMMQNRGFRSINCNKKFVKSINRTNQKYSKQNFTRPWKSENIAIIPSNAIST